MEPPEGRLRIGELAEATGVSVRTLHHYDDIALLRPSGRTPAGHRYYLPRDVERLQCIVSLRQLGLSLDDIGQLLARPGASPLQVLERHVRALDAELEAGRKLRSRLHGLIERLQTDEGASTADFLDAIRETTMFERHFTKDQLDQLAEHGRRIGRDRIREVEQEWPRLIAAVRAEMQRGTDPKDPVVQDLASRWRALVEEFTNRDPGIEASVASLYANEPQARQRTGLDAEIMRYVGRALS